MVRLNRVNGAPSLTQFHIPFGVLPPRTVLKPAVVALVFIIFITLSHLSLSANQVTRPPMLSADKIQRLELGIFGKDSLTEKKIEQFMHNCFAKGEYWKGYSAIHATRVSKTLSALNQTCHIQASSKILHIGDGQGYIPILLHRFWGVRSQISLDLFPMKATYTCLKSTAESDSTDCTYTASSRSTDHLEVRNVDYSIESLQQDISVFDNWYSVEEESTDVIFALEVLEHLTSGPMAFLLNSFRALRQGGVLVLTTPNSSSSRAIMRILKGNNPFSYSPFRRLSPNVVGPEHIKEYSRTELYGALEHAGFSLQVSTTFSPYAHEDISPGLKQLLLNDFHISADQLGEVHFVVAVKNARAAKQFKAFLPLYDFEEAVEL